MSYLGFCHQPNTGRGTSADRLPDGADDDIHAIAGPAKNLRIIMWAITRKNQGVSNINILPTLPYIIETLHFRDLGSCHGKIKGFPIQISYAVCHK